MEVEKIHTLLDNLNDYSNNNHKLRSSKFALTEVQKFKKYFNQMHLFLVEYIQFTKDKKLARVVKEIVPAKEIFKEITYLMTLLMLIISISTFVLIYMYFIQVQLWFMVTITFGTTISVFVLMRRIQNQPLEMIVMLKTNNKICKKLYTLINNKEKSLNL